MSQPSGVLYSSLVQAGCTLSSRECDLLVLATPDAEEIVREFKEHGRDSGAEDVARFVNPADGKVWMELPFQCAPWWDAHMHRRPRSPAVCALNSAKVDDACALDVTTLEGRKLGRSGPG